MNFHVLITTDFVTTDDFLVSILNIQNTNLERLQCLRISRLLKVSFYTLFAQSDVTGKISTLCCVPNFPRITFGLNRWSWPRTFSFSSVLSIKFLRSN